MRKTTLLKTLLLLCALVVGNVSAWADTYEQLTSIANIDESAEYVLGIDGTGFHYEGTSSWGKTALPSAQTPIKYTLTKAQDGNSFTAQATISGTTYYLQVPTSNTFSMATSAGTNTDLIIGTTQVSGTNYAVANKTTTARHLRINGASGLRSYAGTTGTMAFFYKVVVESSAYTITVQSNNESYGTVSLSGATITATPATGYRVSTTTPYTINSGTATVTQDGNQFTVTASTDCTITINFEAKPTVSGYTVDFESDATEYSDWTFTNIESNYKHTEVDTHGGFKYGHTSSNYSTGSIQTKEKVNPASLTCYVSKQSTNTNTSTWYVQFSSDGSNWTNAGSRSASDMTKGEWKEFTVDLSNYSDVYVRVYYSGSTAIRLIDDLTLVLQDSDTPFISADNVELEYDATTGFISYTINNVEGGTLTAATTANWLTLGNVGETIPFTCSANPEPTERTATVTLTYTYGENETINKEVTVTQAAYVVDFATLPFSFNSGKAAIENTSGLTHFDLGNDYSADNTKLKFDGSGDELVLKLNEAPGTIQFNILGNSFSGGTFKIQTSTDGENYNDLASYPSDIDDGSVTLYNTNVNVRYIKWIYTTKVSGNVGIGNINVIAGFSKAVTEVGWATWNAPCAVSFPEGVNAYLVTVNSDPTKVSLIEVSDVPANTPVLLEASAGTYEMSRVESSTTSTEGNLLRVSTGTNSGTMYVLAKVDEVVGFYMWDPNKTLPEGKIYLEMPGSTARPFIALPGEETGISDMNRETVTNNRYFDLQGRRVAQPTKGMYIVNGKKVVVK